MQKETQEQNDPLKNPGFFPFLPMPMPEVGFYPRFRDFQSTQNDARGADAFCVALRAVGQDCFSLGDIGCFVSSGCFILWYRFWTSAA